MCGTELAQLGVKGSAGVPPKVGKGEGEGEGKGGGAPAGTGHGELQGLAMGSPLLPPLAGRVSLRWPEGMPADKLVRVSLSKGLPALPMVNTGAGGGVDSAGAAGDGTAGEAQAQATGV